MVEPQVPPPHAPVHVDMRVAEKFFKRRMSTVKFRQPGIVSNANVLTWVGTRFPPHKSLA